jgi:hypothetical protein
MKYFIARGLRITCPDLCLVLACLLTPLIHAQSANGVQSAPAATPVEAMQRVITLEPPTGWDLQVTPSMRTEMLPRKGRQLFAA